MYEENGYIWKTSYKEFPACDNTKASVVEKQPMFVRLTNIDSCEKCTRKSVIYGKEQI